MNDVLILNRLRQVPTSTPAKSIGLTKCSFTGFAWALFGRPRMFRSLRKLGLWNHFRAEVAARKSTVILQRAWRNFHRRRSGANTVSPPRVAVCPVFVPNFPRSTVDSRHERKKKTMVYQTHGNRHRQELIRPTKSEVSCVFCATIANLLVTHYLSLDLCSTLPMNFGYRSHRTMPFVVG